MWAGDGLRNQRIEDAHQNAAGQTDLNSTRAESFPGGLTFAIGQRVDDDGENHEKNAAEQQQGISERRDDIIQEYAHDQRQADTNWKSDR